MKGEFADSYVANEGDHEGSPPKEIPQHSTQNNEKTRQPKPTTRKKTSPSEMKQGEQCGVIFPFTVEHLDRSDARIPAWNLK